MQQIQAYMHILQKMIYLFKLAIGFDEMMKNDYMCVHCMSLYFQFTLDPIKVKIYFE
jgi:hypothetical protein